MECKKINNGIMCFSRINFKCPYCQKEYIDNDDKYYHRIDKAKTGIARIKCECDNQFRITSDMLGDMVSFK